MNWDNYFNLDTTKKEPVDYVNMKIGAISHTLQPTRPTVHVPNSMVRLLPVWTPGILDWYAASKIYGFSLNVPAHRGQAVTTIMATFGDISLNEQDIASNIDHDFELLSPYHYAVLLEDSKIIAEYTPAARSAMFQFTATNSGITNIIFRCKKNGFIEWLDDSTVRGFEVYHGTKQYFYATLSRSSSDLATFFQDSLLQKNKTIKGDSIGAVSRISLSAGDKVLVKSGISFISMEQAEKNVKTELPNWDFESAQNNARGIWNDTLGKINITTENEAQKRVFYSAFYRCFERMVNISEDNQYYSAYDQQIHQDSRPFYVDDWVWDTYRTVHPLRLLLFPQMEQDMIQSFIRMYTQSGWMPTFPQIYGDMKAMIGHHQAALIADTYLKGYRDFDIIKAYEGLKKNATEGTMIPWNEGPATELDKVYREKGFFPALHPDANETFSQVDDFENRQAVAVTLDHSYDDWCLAQLAKDLDRKNDYELFIKRSKNYQNVFNPETGFMAPRCEDGSWIKPFDPKFSGGIGGRQYFAEMNSWTYTWHVQHDVKGLINLMGGKDRFLKKLDQMFHEDLGLSKWRFLGQFPDATGLIGQFASGNEQSFHIPYLFNIAGAPWKTQKRIRQVMDTWFRDDLMGICGDEDGGALSAWLVLSAIGFYPVCPGDPVYYFGSPLFEKVVLHLGNDKVLVIKAENVSSRNKYIQSVTINGVEWSEPWFEHKQIENGGEIVLQMGPRPNKSWGIISGK